MNAGGRNSFFGQYNIHITRVKIRRKGIYKYCIIIIIYVDGNKKENSIIIMLVSYL